MKAKDKKTKLYRKMSELQESYDVMAEADEWLDAYLCEASDAEYRELERSKGEPLCGYGVDLQSDYPAKYQKSYDSQVKIPRNNPEISELEEKLQNN